MKKKTSKPKSKKEQKIKTVLSEEQIRQQLLEIISNLGKISKETIEKSNKENFSQLGLDSFTLVEIVFSIENTFDIDIPQDSLTSLRTFDDVLRLVTDLVKKRG